jgi:hypothetical protein
MADRFEFTTRDLAITDTPDRVWRPSGVAQVLQTPPDTPDRV